jgi:hypothetical protein
MTESPDEFDQEHMNSLNIEERLELAVNEDDAILVDRWMLDEIREHPQRFSDLLQSLEDSNTEYIALIDRKDEANKWYFFKIYVFRDVMENYISREELDNFLTIPKDETIREIPHDQIDTGEEEELDKEDLVKYYNEHVADEHETDHESELFDAFSERGITNPERWSMTDDYNLRCERMRILNYFGPGHLDKLFDTLNLPEPNRYIEAYPAVLSLTELIKQGEDERLELKETFKFHKHKDQASKELKEDNVKEIDAMANNEGGKIIFGVNDDTEITGLDKDYDVMSSRSGDRDSFEGELEGMISGKIGPELTSLLVDIEFREIRGNDICVVSVSKSPEPVFFGDDDKFFVRSGSSKREFTPKEYENYKKERF